MTPCAPDANPSPLRRLAAALAGVAAPPPRAFQCICARFRTRALISAGALTRFAQFVAYRL